MRKLAIFWLIGAALCAVASRANAEPGPAITSLMNTPTSMFTFGMMRLRDQVQEIVAGAPWIWKDNAGIISGTMYNWDANRIDIFVSSNREFSDKDSFELSCADVFFTLRTMAGVDISTGKGMFDGISLFSSFFAPIGYTNDRSDANQIELDKIFNLLFTAKVASVGSGRCTASLLSTGYSTSYSH